MRMYEWNPNKADATFQKTGVDFLVKAAKVIRNNAKKRLAQEIGKGKTTGINRPVSGPNAPRWPLVPWTARTFGELMYSIRVVQQKTPITKKISKKRNVRVYAGQYMAFYPQIFEFYRPFFRPAVEESIPTIEATIKAD